MSAENDSRIVLTLDAGGTNFVFSAIQANQEIVSPVRLASQPKKLDRCLEVIESGFRKVLEQLDQQGHSQPVAISFAFPGPADYPNGIIGDLVNFPAFTGGVALGPYLQQRFDLPTFINNDGNLFAYGEAIAGLLPRVNSMLQQAGSPKRYRTLIGVTLGTGFGGGLVHNGELLLGDNSNSGEVWLLRNKVRPECFAEEGASIRAVRGAYARQMGIGIEEAPNPKQIAAIAMKATSVESGDETGETKTDEQSAAIAAYGELGEVVGDALANASTLLDGLIVIGGGISKAHAVFMKPLIAEMNSTLAKYDGGEVHRIVQKVFNLESSEERERFAAGATKTIRVPGSAVEISYDPMQRIGVGVSTLGTSRAVSIGAYAFALNKIDEFKSTKPTSED